MARKVHALPVCVLAACIGLSGCAPVSVAAAPAAAPSCASTTGTGKSFAGQDLSNHNFRADPPGSLVGANFSNAKLSGAVFAGQDLTNARFDGANLGPSRGPVDFTNTTLTNTCFIGAALDSTDLSYAVVTCADFSNTSMMLATFGPAQNFRQGSGCRTKFVGATLDVHMITNDFAGKSNWSKSDFTRANFQNLSPSTFSLAGKDITGAILAYTNFMGIDMTGANLTDVDFTGATLTRARLDNAAINGARFTNAQAISATFICAQGYGTAGGQKKPDGTACPTVPVTTDAQTNADFTYAALKNADFTSATLDHAVFSGANMNGATFSNASFVQANLQSTGATGPANVQFATFTRANFSNAQLSSVDFSGGVLTAAVFDGTTLNGTSFSDATMPKASFQSAKMQSVKFGGALLQSGNFAGVQIQSTDGGFGANFQCTQLGGASFKDATIATGNFANAVMPSATDCCAGASPWCGIIDATQETYPPTIYPVLSSNVTCPNGDVAQCGGAQWRLAPNWQTTGCSSTGLSQTMWSRPQCDGKPGDYVVFNDKNLKACILRTLPGQTEVLLSTAQQVSQVDCPERGIADLTGLENFIALTKLDLSGNALPIFTLAFVAGGKPAPSRLRTLDVSSNQLTTLDVTGHPNLLYLTASNNQLASLTASANFAPLVLDLSRNKIATFDLAVQSSLAYVDLSYNQITTVTDTTNVDLRQLANAGYIDLSHNLISSIGSIQGLAWNKKTSTGGALQSLFLACNPKLACGDLGVYDGSTYPAASSSMCSRYDAPSSTWKPLSIPDCPPG